MSILRVWTIFQTAVLKKLDDIEKELKKVADIGSSIQAAQAKTQADLDSLTTAFKAFVAGVAQGVITQEKAQAILAAETAEDTSVQGLIDALNAVTNPPAPTT